ncbi:MAG: 3-oxo-5-alpha-steroid 4-dehydrogenase [Chitinophagaceae bacterium]|nr:MAG: 3-oxo-5-alpha-steroid 4-dehydrogenase [Chitinophagaceae bacterium]
MENIFDNLVYIWIAVALLVFPIALFVKAPYGRHFAGQFKTTIQNKWGWVIMEAASPLFFTFFFFYGDVEKTIFHWVLFSLFNAHYINRSFIWPFRIRSGNKKMPLLIMFSALLFNVINGTINGYFLGQLATFDVSWQLYLFYPALLLFLSGAAINIWADNKLISLRKPGETGYKIPKGGLFDKVSCPNLLGECIQWTGWALMAWGPATLSFCIWTWANLLPRALDHHKWYKEKFENYPKERKAIIPYLL